jgi:hypothetical protein
MFFNLKMQVGQQDVLYKPLGCFQCRLVISKKDKIIPINNIAFYFSSLGGANEQKGVAYKHNLKRQ